MTSAGEALASLFGVQGKRVLITGSTSGIGKAAARAFCAAGACVIINSRKSASVEATVKELNAAGYEGSAVGIAGDVSTAEGTDDLCKEVDSLGEPLDVLVHNAGIFAVANFFEIPDSEWQRYFDTNVMSTVRLCRHFLSKMLERNSGRIVVVSSEAGVRGYAAMAQYAMTKSAQINIVRSLAGLTKGTDVTVNAVLPGPTMTEGVAEYLNGVAESKGVTVEEAGENYFKEDEPTSLLARFLTPAEVASPILFLASAASAGINGSAQRVEGGIINAP